MVRRLCRPLVIGAVIFAAGFGAAWTLAGAGLLNIQNFPEVLRLTRVRTATQRGEDEAKLAQKKQKDFEAFAEKIKKSPGDVSLADYYLTVNAMDKAQRDALLPVIDAMPPGRQKDEKWGIFMWIWAQKAPKDLMAYGESLPLGEKRDQLVQMGLNEWSKKQPQDVIAWIDAKRATEYPGTLEKYQRILIEGWVDDKPADALAYIKTLPLETRHDRDVLSNYYRMVVQSMASNGDMQGAMDTLGGITDESLRSRAAVSLAQGWANFAPQEAVGWATSLTGDTRQKALNDAFNTWSRKEPESAMQWAMQLSQDDPSRKQLLAQSVRAWSSVDLDGAAQWINAQPASPERDEVISQFVGQASVEDPAGALVWAQQISDDKARLRSQKRAMRAWIDTDPSAARAYLESSNPFSEKDTADFLNQLNTSN